MLDYLPEIKSDFAVFHQEKDPFRLGSPRFFQLAPYLPSYDGAVRQALTRDQLERDEQRPAHDGDLLAAPTAEEMPDITSIVAMTRNNQGLPSIAYTSDGG